MPSPTVYLTKQQISEITVFKDVILNDPKIIFKNNFANSIYFFESYEGKIIKTEYTHVYFGVYKGVQTYCARINHLGFLDFGPDCKLLAKEVDKFLLSKGMKPANFYFPRASKTTIRLKLPI